MADDNEPDMPEGIDEHLTSPEAFAAYERYGSLLEEQFKAGVLQARIPRPQTAAEHEAVWLIMAEGQELPLCTGEPRVVITDDLTEPPVTDAPQESWEQSQTAMGQTSTPDLTIRIDMHEEGRLIAYTNGHEVDIQANEDGVCVAICRDGIVHTTAKMDWNEPHTNERAEAWEQFHQSAHAPPAQDAAQPEQGSYGPEL